MNLSQVEQQFDPLYSTGAAAEKLGVERTTVVRWIKQGKLFAYRDEFNGHHWVPLSSLKRGVQTRSRKRGRVRKG